MPPVDAMIAFVIVMARSFPVIEGKECKRHASPSPQEDRNRAYVVVNIRTDVSAG
jgi:hypothetical protein